MSNHLAVVDLMAENGRLIEQNKELVAALNQFVAACDTAPPTSFVVEIGMACKVAREALSKVRDAS